MLTRILLFYSSFQVDFLGVKTGDFPHFGVCFPPLAEGMDLCVKIGDKFLFFIGF